MKRYSMTLALLTCAALAHAAPAPYPITINSRSTSTAPIEAYRSSPKTIRVSFTDGATASDITGHTVWMSWSTNAAAATAMTSTVSVVSATGGVADCTFSAAALNHAPGRYLYEVGVTTNSELRVYRQGVMLLRGSPYATGGGTQGWSAAVNIDAYTWTGSFPTNQLPMSTLDTLYLDNGMITNVDWGDIGGTLSDQTDLAALTNGLAPTTALASYVLTASTSGWETASHASFVTATITNGLAPTAALAAYVPTASTSGWETASHSTFVTATITNGLAPTTALADYVLTASTSGWETASHSTFVTAAITNGLQPSGAYVTATITNGIPERLTAIEAYTNAADTALQPADTNGWVTSTHADLYPRTNPSNYVDRAGATQDMATVAQLADLYPRTNPSNYVSFAELNTTNAAQDVLIDAATNHAASTSNPHTVTLQQAVNAGGTATNMGAVTMVGDLTMGTNTVTGQRFGELAGNGATGTDWIAVGKQAGNLASGDDWIAVGERAGESASGYGWDAFGWCAGVSASGDDWGAFGHFTGNSASGDDWGAFGWCAGLTAIHTNSHCFGKYAGYRARGNNRMYLDVYSGSPDYAADGATNDTIFMDTDGVLYLGGGGGRAENPSAGGQLRGPWLTTDGDNIQKTLDTTMQDIASNVIDIATAQATADAAVASNTQYQIDIDALEAPSKAVTTLASAPVVTITASDGPYLDLLLTNAAVLTFDTSTYPTNMMSFVALGLNLGGNSLTLSNAAINATQAAALTLNVSTNYGLIFTKFPRMSKFMVHGGKTDEE